MTSFRIPAACGKYAGREQEAASAVERASSIYHDANRPLYLLMVYAKAQREDMTADEKRTVRTLAKILKGRG